MSDPRRVVLKTQAHSRIVDPLGAMRMRSWLDDLPPLTAEQRYFFGKWTPKEAGK